MPKGGGGGTEKRGGGRRIKGLRKVGPGSRRGEGHAEKSIAGKVHADGILQRSTPPRSRDRASVWQKPLEGRDVRALKNQP